MNAFKTLRGALCPFLIILSSVLYSQEHPRMFFDADEIPALRAKVQNEPYASMLAQIIKNINSHDYNQRGGNLRRPMC